MAQDLGVPPLMQGGGAVIGPIHFVPFDSSLEKAGFSAPTSYLPSALSLPCCVQLAEPQLGVYLELKPENKVLLQPSEIQQAAKDNCS